MPDTPSRIPVKSTARSMAANGSNNGNAADDQSAQLPNKRFALEDATTLKPTRPSAKPVTKFSSTGIRSDAPPTTASSLVAANKGNLAAVAASLAKWDTKGRIETLEESVGDLANVVAAKDAIIDALNGQVELLKERVAELQRERTDLQQQLSSLTATHTEQDRGRIAELQAAVETAKAEREAVEGQLERLTRRLADAQVEANALQLTIGAQAATLVGVEAQLAARRVENGQLQSEAVSAKAQLDSLQATVAAQLSRIAEMEAAMQQGERVRRKLHNDVQELRGNIRVFCRVRPLLSTEQGDMQHIGIVHSMDDAEQLVIRQAAEAVTGEASSRSFPFTFDRVFGPDADQEAVFAEISQLAQSALDGYRVCIFAYGQTGSGKTYTMEGLALHSAHEAHMGMIPRAVQQIFRSAGELGTTRRWSFSFEASYLEIYNESIRDLLSASSDGTHTVRNTFMPESEKHEIRHAGTHTSVTDLTVVPVYDFATVLELLRRAGKNRAVAETLCNDRSSRSHSVFTLRIVGENGATGEKIDGLLNLIDLAGSERLSQSGSTGDRLKETQAINKSLSSLGDVIAALAGKESHVPFRNSKLTYLLQNSLGGNCKTLMFVNVSPSVGAVQETLCSLRFATKVNACHIGTARRVVVAPGKKP